jgi:uncharacterized protein involved in exopolysaccharide biosynthesis
MEEKQRGERFTIMDAASLPTRPYKPNRLAIMLLGFVLASGLALGTTAIQEGMDHTIKTESHLAELSGLPVLTSISLVETEEDIKARRKRNLMIGMISAGGFALVLLIVNIFITPLDDLWQLILSRLAL